MGTKAQKSVKPGSYAFRILELLKVGNWTTRQIAACLNYCLRDVASAILKLRKGKVIHRCGWTSHVQGDHGGPQAIYAIGWAEEAKQPKPITPKGSSLKYARRQQELKRKRPIASVFDLADRYR